VTYESLITWNTQLQILLQLFSVQWKKSSKNVKFSSPYLFTKKKDQKFSQKKSYYSEVMTKN